MAKIDYTNLTLMEIGLIVHEAVKQFDKKMKIDFPEGKSVKFQLSECSEVLEGTVSKHQFMPADAVTEGILLDISKEVQDNCPTWMVNQDHGFIRLKWTHVYRAI